MIREAFHKDVPDIGKLAFNLIRERDWEEASGVAADPYSLETLTRLYLRMAKAFVRVHETNGIVDGFFVGALEPYLLDIRQYAAHQVMSGGDGVDEMWNEFKQWAREKKAVTVIIGCYDESEGSRFRRIL